MANSLYALMEAGRLSPLSYYFARFVARGCGLDLDSPLAWSAALVSLRNLRGDVCVDLARYAGRPLFEPGEETDLEIPQGPALKDWLGVLRAAPWVGEPGYEAPLVLDGRRLYLGKYWRFERQVAGALRARGAPLDAELDEGRLAAGLERLFGERQDSAGPDWQRIAVAVAVRRRFAVISGGPGTGKTTTVIKVLALLLEQDPLLRIALAAPTGKAAARLAEAIRHGQTLLTDRLPIGQGIPAEAETLHRLLGATDGGLFRHGRDNRLLLDGLVVDEASMIDLPLMARLLEALPDRARLLLLGDRDQLASVEAGSVLGDITGHGQEILYTPEQQAFLERVGAIAPGALSTDTRAATADPEGDRPPGADAVVLLHTSHRFRAGSGIAALARTVNAGRGQDARRLLERRDFAHPAWAQDIQAAWEASDWEWYRREGFGDLHWLAADPDALDPRCLAWAAERYAEYLGQTDAAAALQAFSRYRVLAALRQ